MIVDISGDEDTRKKAIESLSQMGVVVEAEESV
jgi:hypothetical protein